MIIYVYVCGDSATSRTCEFQPHKPSPSPYQALTSPQYFIVTEHGPYIDGLPIIVLFTRLLYITC